MFGNLWDFFWGMMIIFFFVVAVIIWFQCFMDVFRRTDMGGGMKVIWVVVLFVIPWFGALIYIIARPKVTASDVQALAAAEAVSNVSTADELAKLADLKAKGVVTDAQYEDLKAKLLA